MCRILFVHPAIKLVDFFRHLSNCDLQVTRDGRLDVEVTDVTFFSSSRTQDMSKTMRELKPLGSEDIELWVKYWDEVGLFDSGLVVIRQNM